MATANSYTGVIVLLVMFLAIQTRHVKQNFKDTKKVNVYIFTTVTVLAVVLPLWYVFENTRVNSLIGGHIALTVGFLSVGALCELFLFAPKTIPLLCERNKNRVLLSLSLPSSISHHGLHTQD